MLTGKFFHSLDTKNRIIIPAKLKEQLGEKITILRSSDRCLTMYSEAEWESYARMISELPKTKSRAITRYLYSNSVEVQPDSQGRVMIPAEMLEWAGITRNVVTLGCGKYAEIWAEDIWREEEIDAEPENYTEMLQELGL